MDRDHARSLLALWLLFAINATNFFDRQILSAVYEPIRKEWGLTDTQLGWLGTSFTLLYAIVGVPLGRLADTWRRTRLLGIGLAVWSGLTCISGFCRGFWSLFAARLGVGIGEATCAPASSSLIGDLFLPLERARALAIFMLGLPLGVALSYIISGTVAQHYGWRAAFFVAGIPGLFLTLMTVLLQEPARGRAEARKVGVARRPGSPYAVVLGIPTMLWIIASGALHNFNMYALSSFLPSFLIRHHGSTVQNAGFIAGIVIGSLGAIGMLLGGWSGDALARRRPNGRLMLAAVALLISVPAQYLALNQSRGALTSFVLFQAVASMMMYVYYATVYSAIQDIVEPALRGTAMALYFLAMYMLGAALGPVAAGWASDRFAHQAALESHMVLSGSPPEVVEQFKAVGLQRAMYIIPAVGVVLTAVLFAAASTVRRDAKKLQDWARSVSA